MKNNLRLGSAVLFMGAALICSSHAFATETVLKNEQVQEKLKSMTPEERQQAATTAKEKYNGLSADQQEKVKEQEKNRLNKIHNTNQESKQES